jgi:putative oxidoreductase
MAVIAYPQLWAFDCPAAINDHKYWGILLLVLLAFGGGRLALDYWLGGKGRGEGVRRQAAPQAGS